MENETIISPHPILQIMNVIVHSHYGRPNYEQTSRFERGEHRGKQKQDPQSLIEKELANLPIDIKNIKNHPLKKNNK